MISFFKGKNNKTYVVGSSNDGYTVLQESKKHFKISESRIAISRGWVVGEDLYLIDPHMEDAQPVWVGYTRYGT